MFENWRKSELQEKLETEGWEWLSNVSIEIDSMTSGYAWNDNKSRTEPKTDDQLQTEFKLRNGFKDVMIADAYDANGKPVPGYRAVYVKRKETDS